MCLIMQMSYRSLRCCFTLSLLFVERNYKKYMRFISPTYLGPKAKKFERFKKKNPFLGNILEILFSNIKKYLKISILLLG